MNEIRDESRPITHAGGQQATEQLVVGTLREFIVGLAHIGYVVEDMAAAIARFKHIYGVDDDAIRVIPPLGSSEAVETRFAFVNIGVVEFELIEPVSEYFRNILFARPSGIGGINHVAFEVKNIEQAVECMQKAGVPPGHVTPNGVVNFGNKKLVYFDPQAAGMLLELVEISH